ncbi:Icc-related predicted phosphoesterase [Deinobacterium chartae]|uniref:Icc-related predicted phosphoesterase n=1 Tax=Deinobacterium chartae TaxID=521158 RepID=A0A841I5F0_9DEIO|nr:metallophosphoesterase [Deinobacterium chartae]MBB6099172.1 Icc-related predicted phosphoesterase [Deinobacterium chartae]
MPTGHRLLLLADYVHPYVYRTAFPDGVPEVDLALVAGDVPGYYLEFLATKLTVPVVYVPGNHGNEQIREDGVRRDPQGVINAHGRVLEVGGLVIAGFGGVPKYREQGEGQYTEAELNAGFRQLNFQMWLRSVKRRPPLDILLTHAPPVGPHAGSDFAHRGMSQINAFAKRHHPRLIVHGHIHEYEGKKVEYLEGSTRVVNAYGYRVIDLSAESVAQVG